MSDHKTELVHRRFESQAQRVPERTAVSDARVSFTYRELNASANRLAQLLIRRGIGPEQRVGILLERSADWLCAVLGVLKSGGAYVPLDVLWPRSRIEGIARDAALAALVSRRRSLAAAGPQLGKRILMEEIEEGGQASSERDPAASLGPENAAYVIYTSGSTGRPKGVVVEHRSLANLGTDLRQAVYREWSRDGLRLALNGPLAFDTSVKQLIQLCRGHSLYVVPEHARLDSAALGRFLAEHRIEAIDCTPTQLQSWLSQGLFQRPEVSLKAVLVGGEAIEGQLWSRLCELREVAFYNLYGPTECTVDALTCRIDASRETPRIGTPLRGAQVRLLDRSWQPLSRGRRGELSIGGAGLARCYLNRPGLTASRFVPDESSNQPGSRLYLTGDLGRQLGGGEFEFLGRTDHQVKLRGVRIELGEIEAILRKQPDVREAAVVLQQGSTSEERLIAYVVPETELPEQGRRSAIAELRRKLRESLPEYMMPSGFVFMTQAPVTPNGKLDRAALRLPPDFEDEASYVAPRTPVEWTVAAIWCNVLGLSAVGVHDNFFELGGHSLLAGQVAARIQEALGREVPLSTLFEGETVAKVSASIEASAENGNASQLHPIRPRTRRDHHAVSFAQERICFVQRLAPSNVAYLFRTILRFMGTFNVPALERTLSEIVRRHESLRTTFLEVEGRPRQRVHPPWRVRLPLIDLTRLGERAGGQLARMRDELFRRNFDIGQLPLIRWLLVRLGEEEHALLHVEHHLIHDGWSLNVFLYELREIYSNLVRGRPTTLDELPIQLVDFCEWQQEWVRSDEAQRQLAFWKDRLQGAAPVLELAVDRPRPATQSFQGAIERIEMPAAFAGAVRKASRRENVTLFMMMLAAYFVLLSRYSGQGDICVGSGIANRRRRETESLIGMIINSVVMRVDLGGGPTFRDLLRQVRATTLGAYANQDFPFDAVVDALRPTRDISHNPLFQVAFGFHDAPLPDLDLPGASLSVEDLLDNGSAKFDMNIVAIPRVEQRVRDHGRPDSAGVTLIWEYNTDLFDRSTIRRMYQHYVRILDAICSSPEMRIDAFTLLTAAERRRFDGLNATQTPIPQACIHELFREHALRTPDKIAAVSREGSLSYGSLHRWTNRLARHLRRAGMGPGSLIGVCLRRSEKLPAALLAIHKAGAAYLPLDHSHPAARTKAILQDAGAELIVSDASTRSAVSECGTPIVDLDQDRNAVERAGSRPLECAVRPGDLAYVIYTSGSTGRPKGIALSHRSLTNLITCMRSAIGASDDPRVFSATNITFDIAALELFLPMTCGGACWVASSTIGAGAAVLDELARSRADLVQATPSGWKALLEQGWQGNRRLTALSGGETLATPLSRDLLDNCGAVFNVYGPSETTIWSTLSRVRRENPTAVIGAPLANTRTFVLDRALQQAPVGVTGELAIAGAGLAFGYLNRPRLTALCFRPDPFSDRPGSRLYRSGDLVRRLSDGNLDFIGREDHQVKVLGYRIELGEIEAALLSHAGVKEAVVEVREDRRSGDKRLAAYLVARGRLSDQERSGCSEELRRRLKETLPDYMLPGIMVWMDSLPLTANGKVNRGALPDPRSTQGQSPTPPRNPVEASVAAIWREVLEREEVSVHDDFFRLGGHSFNAMQVVSRIWRDLEVDLPLNLVFEMPVLADFAAGIQGLLPAAARSAASVAPRTSLNRVTDSG